MNWQDNEIESERRRERPYTQLPAGGGRIYKGAPLRSALLGVDVEVRLGLFDGDSAAQTG